MAGPVQSFRVSCTRNGITLLLVLLIPLVAAAIFIVPITGMPGLPDWAVWLTIIVMMTVAISSLQFINTRWGTVPAEVTMDAECIRIRLLRRTLLYPRTEYAAAWEALESVSSDYDPRNNRRIYLIRFRQPSVTVSLMPAEMPDSDTETLFGQALLQHVEKFNATQGAGSGTRIRRSGFYDTWWARGLTIAAYLMIAIVVILRFSNPPLANDWQVAQALFFGLLWLGAYHLNRRRKT